jgi:hypothetical protein
MIEDFQSMGIKIMKAADNYKAVLGVLTNDLFKTVVHRGAVLQLPLLLFLLV